MSQKTNKQIKTVLLHTSAWAVVLLLSMLDTETMTINKFMVKHSAPLWMFYIVVFYINYLILMPRFLFKKKTVKYIVFSFLLIGASFGCLKVHMLYNRKIDMQNRLVYILSNTDDKAVERGKDNRPTKREREIEYLKNELSKAFNISLFMPTARYNVSIIYRLLLVLAISMVLRFTQRWKSEEELRQQIEREHIASELEYLKQQINPHFLFNALNSIYSLTLPHSDTASNSILKLSSILRYMLYETESQKVLLDDEIAVIEDYIGLQELRLTEKTKLRFTKSGSTEFLYIDPLLLIPIIENAFKYGVDSAEDSFIDIRLSVEFNHLVMNVRNKIVKYKRENESFGIGIKNIRRRLDLLYPNNYILKTEEVESVFSVYLSIPIHSHNDAYKPNGISV